MLDPKNEIPYVRMKGMPFVIVYSPGNLWLIPSRPTLLYSILRRQAFLVRMEPDRPATILHLTIVESVFLAFPTSAVSFHLGEEARAQCCQNQKQYDKHSEVEPEGKGRTSDDGTPSIHPLRRSKHQPDFLVYLTTTIGCIMRFNFYGQAVDRAETHLPER